jgi:hypothetical protein
MTGQFVRLFERSGAENGFTLDGAPMTGRAGDTVLTAILLHAGNVGPHEFLAHDRAGLCLMGACQACWVQSADGTRLRGCSTLLQPGMDLRTGRPA